jgi:signal transduction histidine kinase
LDEEANGMSNHYAELAELSGGFIHEIKNHLSTLGLNMQLLAEDFQDPQSPRERRALSRVQKVQAQLQQLIGVANDFLRYARIKDLKLSPISLSQVVEEMIDFFAPTAQAAKIHIKSFIPADLPPVRLDVDLFKQAILNLMLNAEQAMPEGGEIAIQACVEESADCGAPETAGDELCPFVTLHVIDTGQGMSDTVLARIFEPFFSTKKSGSGLGLPTTRRIVEAHGGAIAIESAAGRGTKVTLRLPAQYAPVAS